MQSALAESFCFKRDWAVLLSHIRPHRSRAWFRSFEPLRRFVLGVEVVFELAFAWWRWKVMPFKDSFTSSAVPLGSAPRHDMEGATRLLRVVDQLADRVPFRAVCYQRALAGQRILRKRGYDAVLHYGVKPTRQRLIAHVWLSLQGRTFISRAERKSYGEVAQFPALYFDRHL